MLTTFLSMSFTPLLLGCAISLVHARTSNSRQRAGQAGQAPANHASMTAAPTSLPSCIRIAADTATSIPVEHATTHCLVLADPCVSQCLLSLSSTYLRLGLCDKS